MSRNIETELGIPSYPPITEHKFTVYDPLISEVTEVICDVFNLNFDVAHSKILLYVTESLNKEKGHPARIIFLKIIFQTIHEYVKEANDEQWKH